MLNLNTCVKGQKLRLHNGMVVTYVKNGWSSDYPHETRAEEGDCFSYTCDGSYHADGAFSGFNVAEILPLETTDSPKLDKHPSVTWWESCPWITDRKPAEEDGDVSGWVMTKLIDSSSTLTSRWSNVKAGDPWVHRPRWKPPTLTDKEQALQLLDDHRDDWRPTPEQWHIIRKGLGAS